MGTQNEDATPAEGRRALLHDKIAFFLVDRVGQRVSAEWRVFRDGRGQVGAIRRYAAGKNELPNRAPGIPVSFGYGFHYTGSAPHVDPPPLGVVQDTRTLV